MSNALTEYDREQAAAFVDQAVGSALPTFVFNSVVTSTTASEILAVTMLGSRPLATWILNPVVAKTLAASLTARVKEYEAKIGFELPTIDQL